MPDIIRIVIYYHQNEDMILLIVFRGLNNDLSMLILTDM